MNRSIARLLFGKKNRITRRLIVLVIAFSSLITLFISVVQLALEYRGLRSAMERQLDGIAIYVPTIAGSVWDFDEKQIQRVLDALALLPDVAMVRVVASDTGKEWRAGLGTAGATVIRSYPLHFNNRGQTMEIGMLEVVAGLDGIYRQIWHVALGILLSNALKTLLVATFMVYLFRRMITLRLERMADKVHALAPGILPWRQVVETAPQPIPAGLDELAAVDWMLDKTADDLGVAVRALNDLNADLERRITERTKELESFSYSVSHDLRTPLRAIDGFSKMLLEDYAERLDDEGRRLLQVVRSNTERMGRLIDDILQFSRMGRQELNMTPLAMESLVRSVFADLQATLGERAVRLDLGALPVALGDLSLIRQVLANLLGNAVKFTQPRPLAVIEVGGELQGEECVFHVRDNGVGFDMRYVDKLFGVFERLHANSEFEGTGIGLAIVRQIVGRHGGRVWAEGKLGAGAVVYFTLRRG